jgi:hypothetical protein
MKLLFPLGLLYILGIAVLVWLWNFASSKYQKRIASLIPFAHLLKKSPKKRSQFVYNILFWLQLASLLLLALAISDPVSHKRFNKTTLVLLDNSASMNAAKGGDSVFKKAKSFLLEYISKEASKEQFYVIKTATAFPLSSQPLGDEDVLKGLIEDVKVASMAGDLASANRIGQALIGAYPGHVMVLTDERRPDDLDPSVDFRSFSEPLGNVAIVGFDAYESLCVQTPSSIVIWAQNFFNEPQKVSVRVSCGSNFVSRVDTELPAFERVSIPIKLQEDAKGICTAALEGAKQDSLLLDNNISFRLKGSEAVNVELASDNENFGLALGRWVDACPRISKSLIKLSSGNEEVISSASKKANPPILITDDEALAYKWPFASLYMAKSTNPEKVRKVQWLIDLTHPLGEYLQPLETVSAQAPSWSDEGFSDSAEQGFMAWAEPVVWGLGDGIKQPIVYASSVEGKRKVWMLIDPSIDQNSVPLIVLVLNSLRWLSGSSALVSAGEPLVVGPFDKGVVKVRRPDGKVDVLNHEGGLFRYDKTDEAGIYRIEQKEIAIERVVNFINPVESNTFDVPSTWQESKVLSFNPPHEDDFVLTKKWVTWIAALLIVLLLIEWVLYSRRRL